MIGKEFGYLTVIREVKEKRKNHRYWLCRCRCGKEIEVEDYHLRSGHTKSCGCYRKQILAERRMDLTGKRYGRLIVLGPANQSEEGADCWICKCDCGNTVECTKDNLRRGRTRSCGCLREEQRKKNMEKAIHFVDGTCVERIAARKSTSCNRSGYRGVYMRENGRWRASIGFKGKIYSLGTFDTVEEAVEARQGAEKEIFDSFLTSYYGQRLQEKEEKTGGL